VRGLLGGTFGSFDPSGSPGSSVSDPDQRQAGGVPNLERFVHERPPRVG